MDNSDDRVSELIAAAVAGELSAADAVELDALRRSHPWIDDEIASLSALVLRLDAAEVTWSEASSEASSDTSLRDRITAGIASEELASEELASAQPSPASAPPARVPAPVASPVRRRSPRWAALMLGAAACIGIGVGAGIIVPAALSAPPSGPPGTLGAVEHIDVRDESAGTAIDADLVAHTWGTEAVVDASGLDVGATYAIVFIGTDGSEFSAGEMLGSSVAIHCRVNAAVLREDVARLEIRDAAGDPVAAAELPNV